MGLGVEAWTGGASATTDPVTDTATDGPADAETGPAKSRRRSSTSRPSGSSSRQRRRQDPPAPDPSAQIPDADHEAVARKILLDQLTGQARTRKELAERLAKRNVPDEIAGRLLDRFEEVGLVDDAAFARLWVDSRQQGKGLARRALAQELRRKGVDDEVAREALEQVDPDDERDAARALVQRKLRSMRGLEPQVATRRLVGMLARKGYSAGMAFAVVREELAAADADLDELDQVTPDDL